MNRLIYIADPMCSWCHGFTPTITKLVGHYQNQLNFSLVMGGLRPGGHTPWDQKMKDFLKHHWEEVARKTGQPFSFDLLEWDRFSYDTEPSCRAVCVVRDLSYAKTFDFYKAIQNAFYVLNNDPNELAFYLPLCKELDIDTEDFASKFESDVYKEKTKLDFAHSRQLGVKGFPTLMMSKGEEIHMVSPGFAAFDRIRLRIDALLG